MKNILRAVIVVIGIITPAAVLNADTILLSDGTYLVGKVVEWDAYHIIFKNSHGAFAIKKKQLVKLYVTGSQLEDIELNRTLGNVMKDEDIIKHYLSGMEGMPAGGYDKETVESGVTGSDLNRKFRMLFSYYRVAGLLTDVIPSAWGVSAGYSQSISGMLPDGAAFWAPLLSVESEYILFSGGSSEVLDISLYSGPRWELTLQGGRRGGVYFQTVPGFTYLQIDNEGMRSSGFTFSFKTSAGYEYSSGNYSGVVGLSYLYVYDEAASIHGLGVSMGAAYKF
ncbi:MAG: hypothetical protein CVV49_14290 [Spirochaetae bacterium HGW-Spirochaetae-5]|nr:MAG: hypothetical protein CVV49_14290 [Spirochaetae bacterium HGW-Spirochaetae-5]